MRSRNIKPGFFINSELAEVDFATRLLFIGLWCFADREGLFEWKPKKIHAAIFPYDHGINVEKMLCNLMSLHLITCHDMVGRIPCFLKHQRPHPHEAKSALTYDEDKVNENIESNQCHDMVNHCHDMSLNVMKCQSDVLMLGCSDILNPDVINNPLTPKGGIAEPEKLPRKKPTELSGIQKEQFETWWSVYPKKEAKKAAIKAWKSLNFSNGLFDKMMAAISIQKESRKYIEGFAPNPATWLNGERWEDVFQGDLPVGKTKQLWEEVETIN